MELQLNPSFKSFLNEWLDLNIPPGSNLDKVLTNIEFVSRPLNFAQYNIQSRIYGRWVYDMIEQTFRYSPFIIPYCSVYYLERMIKRDVQCALMAYEYISVNKAHIMCKYKLIKTTALGGFKNVY